MIYISSVKVNLKTQNRISKTDVWTKLNFQVKISCDKTISNIGSGGTVYTQVSLLLNFFLRHRRWSIISKGVSRRQVFLA